MTTYLTNSFEIQIIIHCFGLQDHPLYKTSCLSLPWLLQVKTDKDGFITITTV